MQAQLTKYYYQWLEDGGIVPNEMTFFPVFNFGENSFNMSELFLNRNKYKEIGAETDELFSQYLKNVINEALVLYYNKITIQIENIGDLMNRIVKENFERNNELYLNPINTNEPQLDSYTKDHGYNEKVYGFSKSNPEIMKAINELDIMYMSALEYMDKVFLGVL